MRSEILHIMPRSFVKAAVAILFALALAYGPVVADALAGASLTPVSFACQHSSGGCG